MASRTDVSQDFASPGVPVLLPVGMKYCSLTGDELTIYCETEVSGAPDLQLWQATRKDLGSQFGEAQKVPDLDTTGFDVSDPSISADGRQLLYGVSVGGANADLRLVERRCQ
jgi:hypothetical protein